MSGLGNYIFFVKDGRKELLRSLFPQRMIPCKGVSGAQISKSKKYNVKVLDHRGGPWNYLDGGVVGDLGEDSEGGDGGES